MHKIAFVQGRLVDQIDNKIQAFPIDTWKDELEIATQNDMKYIELTVDLTDIEKNPLSNEDGSLYLKKQLNTQSIEAIACTADFIMHCPPWISDYKKMQAICKNIIEGLGNIGCRFLVFPLVDNSSIDKSLEEQSIKFLLSLEEYLKKNNVEIVIESDYQHKELKSFIENFPDKYYGINYDIGNSASMGYCIEDEFSSYFDRVKHIHVKDRLLKGSTVPFGSGSVNFDKCFRIIRAYNYKGNFSIQSARDHSGNHVSVMLKYIKMVENLLNE
jgi:L-ribulose-5-phosphate 3-epimerase